MAQFVKIHAMGPDPCDECESLDGETVTRQYWNAHTHPHCKCVAVPVRKKDMTKKERKVAAKLKKKKKASNMEVVDEILEGVEFQTPEAQDQTQDDVEQKQIDENNEVDVQVAVTGNIIGSNKDGEPIEQHITEEALQDIAGALNAENKEILVDKDHQSSREGLDRDTHAMGWLSRFWANAKGLFAKLRLTPTGKALVEGREYRKLSPVFTLDKDGKPLTLESAAFTNTPAMQAIEPILNQKPNEALKMEITKEELVELIKTTVASMNETPEEKQEETPAETQEETPAEQQDEPAEEEKTEEEKTEEAKDECDDKKEEVVDETPAEEPKAEEEKVEEPKAEEAKPAKKKEEVIPEAALNQLPAMPQAADAEPWKNLHGKELMKFIYANYTH